MRRRATMLAVLAGAACGLLSTAVIAAATRTERVTFPKDRPSATVKGTLKGEAAIDYVVAAQAGQTLSIALVTSNASTYFNVTAPGTKDAMFVGSVLGNEFSAKLPLSGDYVVQVYLMRNAARKNESASYTLTISAPPQQQ